MKCVEPRSDGGQSLVVVNSKRVGRKNDSLIARCFQRQTRGHEECRNLSMIVRVLEEAWIERLRDVKELNQHKE